MRRQVTWRAGAAGVLIVRGGGGHTIGVGGSTGVNGTPHPFRSLAPSRWHMNSDGSDPQALTPVVQGQIDGLGSFSPDGTRPAFPRLKLGFIDEQHGLLRNT